MGWNKGYYYKICGGPALPVEGEECLYLLFELENYDRYILTEKARKSAGVLDEEVGEEELEKIRAEAEAAKKAKEEAAASGLKPRKRKKQQHPESWGGRFFRRTLCPAQGSFAAAEIKSAGRWSTDDGFV